MESYLPGTLSKAGLKSTYEEKFLEKPNKKLVFLFELVETGGFITIFRDNWHMPHVVATITPT